MKWKRKLINTINNLYWIKFTRIQYKTLSVSSVFLENTFHTSNKITSFLLRKTYVSYELLTPLTTPTLDFQHSYDSDYDSDSESVASENQPLRLHPSEFSGSLSLWSFSSWLPPLFLKASNSLAMRRPFPFFLPHLYLKPHSALLQDHPRLIRPRTVFWLAHIY